MAEDEIVLWLNFLLNLIISQLILRLILRQETINLHALVIFIHAFGQDIDIIYLRINIGHGICVPIAHILAQRILVAHQLSLGGLHQVLVFAY